MGGRGGSADVSHPGSQEREPDQNELGRTMKWILLGHTCLLSNRGKAMKVKLYLFVETESHCTAPAELLFPLLLPQPP